MADLNPYETPRLSLGPGCYGFDLTKARWREIWRIGRHNGRLLRQVALAKLTGKTFIVGGLEIGRLRFCAIDEVPHDVRNALEPSVSAWRLQGIEMSVAYGRRIRSGFHWALSGMSEDNRAIGTVSYEPLIDLPAQVVGSIGSHALDGTCILTTGEARCFDDDSRNRCSHCPGATIAELWTYHLVRIDTYRVRIRRYERSELRSIIVRHEVDSSARFWERGIMVSLPDDWQMPLR